MNHRATKKLSERLMTEQNSKPKPSYAVGIDTAKKGTKDQTVAVVLVKNQNGTLEQIRNFPVTSAEQSSKSKMIKRMLKPVSVSNYIRPSSAPAFNHF